MLASVGLDNLCGDKTSEPGLGFNSSFQSFKGTRNVIEIVKTLGEKTSAERRRVGFGRGPHFLHS